MTHKKKVQKRKAKETCPDPLLDCDGLEIAACVQYREGEKTIRVFEQRPNPTEARLLSEWLPFAADWAEGKKR